MTDKEIIDGGWSAVELIESDPVWADEKRILRIRATLVLAERASKARELLTLWKKNRASPAYGSGTPGPLYAAGMAAEADAMIAGLEEALGTAPGTILGPPEDTARTSDDPTVGK